MRMNEITGFKKVNKVYGKQSNRYLDTIVHRILAEALFRTRTSVSIDPNKNFIDARYYKVVYLRKENKYLVIGREGTRKLDWEFVPSSVKTMIKTKNIPLIVE